MSARAPAGSIDQPHRHRIRLLHGLWIGWWVVMAVALHLPRSAVEGRTLPVSDKVIHFGLFFVLTALGAIALRARAATVGVRSLAGWCVAYLVYAGIDEWTQGFVGRDVQWGDYFANALGIIAATIIAIPICRAHSTES